MKCRRQWLRYSWLPYSWLRCSWLLWGWLLCPGLLTPCAAAALVDDPHRLARAEIAFTQGLVVFEEASLGDSERLGEAKAWFQRALLHDAQHGSARYWLGLVHLQEGNGSAAVYEIERSRNASKRPRTQRWRLHLHLALAHRLAGQPRRAHRAAKRAFRLKRRQPELLPATTCPEPSELPGLTTEQLMHADHRTLLGMIGPCDLGPFWPPPKEPTWEGSASILFGSDSNPNILDNELILDTPNGELVSGRDVDQVANLGLYLARYFRRGSWNLGLTHRAQADIYRDFSYLNRLQNRVTFHLSQGRDPIPYLAGPLGSIRVPYGHTEVSWLFQIGYHTTRLEGETYSQGFEAAATWVWRPLRASATQVALLIRDRDFDLARNRDQSTLLWHLDASQYVFVRLRNRYLRLGIRLGAHDGDRVYSRALLEPYFEVSQPIGKRCNLHFRGSWSHEEYDYAESNLFVANNDSRPRDDTTLSGHLDFSWALARNLRLVASLYFADRDSELELPVGLPGLGYQRTRTTIGLHWSLR